MHFPGEAEKILKEKSGKILQTTGFLLVTTIAFLGGVFFQKDQVNNQSQVVISIPDYEIKKKALKEEQSQVIPSTSSTSLEPVVNALSLTQTNLEKDCVYVGSKNSTKYHLATCGVAKRIKSENRRCFASEEVAKASGYIAGCLK